MLNCAWPQVALDVMSVSQLVSRFPREWPIKRNKKGLVVRKEKEGVHRQAAVDSTKKKQQQQTPIHHSTRWQKEKPFQFVAF